MQEKILVSEPAQLKTVLFKIMYNQPPPPKLTFSGTQETKGTCHLAPLQNLFLEQKAVPVI